MPQPEQTSSAQVTDNPTPAEGAAVATNAGAVAELTEEEAEQVFDRALEAVIGNLRQLHKRSSPA